MSLSCLTCCLTHGLRSTRETPGSSHSSSGAGRFLFPFILRPDHGCPSHGAMLPRMTTRKAVMEKDPMDYFAHTSKESDGSPDKDRSHWQFLKDHLQNVAALARRFAETSGLADETELANCRVFNRPTSGVSHQWANGDGASENQELACASPLGTRRESHQCYRRLSCAPPAFEPELVSQQSTACRPSLPHLCLPSCRPPTHASAY
jgi:hypothetical protein